MNILKPSKTSKNMKKSFNRKQRKEMTLTNEELMAAMFEEKEIVLIEHDGGSLKWKKTASQKARVKEAKLRNKWAVKQEKNNPGYVMNTERNRTKLFHRFTKFAMHNRLRGNFIIKVTAA